MLSLSRKLTKYIGIKEITDKDFMEDIPGLAGKNVTVLGKGNIGSRVGKLCEAFDMNVSYFKRGDNLLETVKNADFVANCLGHSLK